MSNVLSASEAALRFSDLLDQIQTRGESFLIVRDGREIAQLSSPSKRSSRTFREVVERLLATRTGDPGFADDLEVIQASQPPMEVKDPWAS
jgi:hypothetical protein